MKALLKKSAAAEPFSFSFVNKEEKVALKSENYKSKDSAAKGIRAVKKNCVLDRRLVLKESDDNRYYFNIKSANGQVVATSAMYETESDRSAAIRYMQTTAPDCPITEMI